MYINPNTSIKILHNVPLDDTYEHTIYFGNSSAQSSYFSDLAKYTFEAQSYQRVKRGYIRIAKNAESLYDCNYLMFQNSAFGSKWFYAFIKSVEYINNAVSEIEFKIDVMQTWFFDYTLKECFIEREHSSTDTVGQNIVPENLELGEYVCHSYNTAGVSNKLQYIVDSTIGRDYSEQYPVEYIIAGKTIFSGVSQFSLTPKQLLSWMSGRGVDGQITDGNTINENITKINNGVLNIRLGCPTEGVSFSQKFTNSFNGYTPRNKKLLTYPYNFLYVTNYSGNSAVYKYEYFTNNEPSFTLSTDSMSGSPAILTPVNYKGVPENFGECITLSNFPTCTWNTSYYDRWLANATSTTVPNMITNVVTGAAGGALLGSPETALIGAGLGAISSVVSFMGEKHMAEITPPQAHGSQTGFTGYWKNMVDFGIYAKQITNVMARTIDDYFDKFGYATHRLKIPNRNVRPHWCYTKTVGCTIKGSVPSDDMRLICNIYDKGITFWKKGSEVGNYNLDNSVVTP
jgi:hypothetical protein